MPATTPAPLLLSRLSLHLSAGWLQIRRLFLQKLPLLGCVAAQTPNLLRRLRPRWNASTNTQLLPLSLSQCHFFSLSLLLSLSLLDMHVPSRPVWLPPWQEMGTLLRQALFTLQLNTETFFPQRFDDSPAKLQMWTKFSSAGSTVFDFLPENTQ